MLRVYIRSIGYYLLVFSMIVVSLENLASTSFADRTLLPPSYGFNDTPFDIQQNYLNAMHKRDGKIDCIFVGSSTLEPSIHPPSIAQGYAAYGQQTPFNCFNFGRYGMRNLAAYELLNFLIETYKPKYLIYGITPHAFSYKKSPDDERYLTSPWTNYRHADSNLEGWFTEYSATYRYYLRYENWLDPAFENNSRQISALEEKFKNDGYRPLNLPSFDIRYPPNAVLPAEERNHSRFNKYNADHQGFVSFALEEGLLNELDQILALNGKNDTQLILLDMPLHSTFMDYFVDDINTYTQYMNTVGIHAEKFNVPYWKLTYSTVISDEFWIDRHHVKQAGAYLLSYWLGAQFAVAIASDFTGLSAYQPPLDSVDIPSIEEFLATPFGLPPVYVEEYQQITPFWSPHNFILNPNPQALNPSYLQINIGKYLEGINLSVEKRQANYQTIAWLDTVHNPNDLNTHQTLLLSDWYITYDPTLLTEIGADYVVFSAYWLNSLPLNIQQKLTDPTAFEFIAETASSAFGATFLIYRPMGGS